MHKDKINNLLEQLSCDFVMADPSAPELFINIQSEFEKIAELAGDSYGQKLPGVAIQAKEIAGKIAQGDVDDPQAMIDLLGNTLAAMQSFMVSDMNFEEAGFPVELVPAKASTPPAKPGGLHHPGELPWFLDKAAFAEFLACQNNAMERLEILILAIEQGEAGSLDELRRLIHTLKGESAAIALEEVESLCHKIEDVLENDNYLESIDLLLAVKDWLTRAFDAYSGKGNLPEPAGALLAQLKQVAAQNLKPEPDTKLEIEPDINREPAPESESKDMPLISHTSTAMETTPAMAKAPKAGTGSSTVQVKKIVNVEAYRLDKLVDTIGELAIAESIVCGFEEITQFASPEFSKHIGLLGKIIKDLQRQSLSLRMVPIKPIFMKMNRIVRDLAKKEGKKVNLIMSGEETELDKSLVEKISDPLIHLIRNAVDHGIEDSVEQRLLAGKPETGKIEIRAFHKGGNIIIEIKDDGRGIDHEALMTKALEMGIVHKGESLGRKEVYNLIFTSGFSTAKKVTAVSGRGVGMDVVRQTVDGLLGQIDVQSQKGKGSVFGIRIPLTLAIIDGMIVGVGAERYIIPALSVITSNRFKGDKVNLVLGRGEILDVHGSLIPLMRLNRLFGVQDAVDDVEQGIVVVVEEDEKRKALLVDELLSKQQIVIKSLGRGMQDVSGISGCAIMPDGRVGLILDIGGLIRLDKQERGAAFSSYHDSKASDMSRTPALI